MSDLQKALDDIAKNTDFYVTAGKYMDGTAPEKFSSAAMARLLKGSANRFRMNYARVPVTAICNRVRIASFGVEGNDEANTFLQKAWRDNGLENLYREVHLKTGGTGSAYLMAWPNPDDPEGVDVSMCDPITTRAFYDPENPRRVLYVARTWSENKRVRVNLYYKTHIEKYISRGRSQGKLATAFEPYYDLYDEVELDGGQVEVVPVWPIPNPYDRIPIFHFRVGPNYGRPLNADAWEPQDGINKLTSTMMSTVDYMGFPQRYKLQKTGGNPESSVIDDWDVSTSGEIKDGDDVEPKLKAGPAGLWDLEADAVGEFSAAKPEGFLTPMEQYIKSISTLCNTPLHAFHGMGDAPSGESLRAANAPLNDAATDMAGWVEPTWLDFFSFILEVGEIDATVEMLFANPEKADDTEFWSAITGKVAAGVPLRKALQDAGYTTEQIDEWYGKGRTARNNAELKDLADVIQKISASVSLGVITVDEARALLPEDVVAGEAPDAETVLAAAGV